MSDPGAGAGARVPFRARSRAVAWAKVLLPLAALALLSTLFLLARAPEGPAAIPFAEIEAIADQSRLDAPRLAGVAPDGTAVALSADRLVPLPAQPDGFRALAPRLVTASPTGLVARLSAEEGEVLGPTRTLRLTGGVALDGESPAAGPLAVRTDAVTADLASGTLTALGGVRAVSRLGTLTAEAMRVEQGQPATAGGPATARVVFNGSVRLVYEPPAAAPGAPAPEAPAP